MENLLTISKLDAAKRQLETVIRMYFNSGDPVSMHTLTAAAYNVIHDVNKKRSGKPMIIKEQLLDYVKQEHKKEFRDKMNDAENFFKHADRDHEANLDFNPNLTELLISDACDKYHELTGEWPPLFLIYRSWMMLARQELFDLPADIKQAVKFMAPNLTADGRAIFFSNMLPQVMKNGI